MIRRKSGSSSREMITVKVGAVKEFLKNLIEEKPLMPLVIPLIMVVWAAEKWVFSFSNWVPLFVAVWASLQYGSHQRKILAEDLERKWKRVIRNASPITPLEQCEWLNKLLIEVWSDYMNPKLSSRFSSLVEKRLKSRKSRLIETVELQEFSLGSCPPSLGLDGVHWSTSGDQRILHLGFHWDTVDMSILLLAKLAKPLIGTARIVVNSLHIKGDLLLEPVLDGRAVMYSFVSAPEVRIGVAFGSGGSQSLPATELPGVSSWLVKVLTDTIVKTMVAPRRRCFTLPAVDLRKKAVGGIIYVTVISANKLSRNILKGALSKRQYSSSNGSVENYTEDRDIQTFVEVELEELTRKTDVRMGSSPRWDSIFNMVLHDEMGTLRFNLYERTPGSVNYDYLASCEVKVKYSADDSIIFWAIGQDSTIIAKRAEFCGKEVEMAIPFEGVMSAELKVRLVLKEWQFSDGSHSLKSFHVSSSRLYGSSNLPFGTGRKINITLVEGKDLIAKEKYGKSGAYAKLHYGKTLQRTRTAQNISNPLWNQKFEFSEMGGGEYLIIKCYSEDTFNDESIGTARVNLEGLVEGSVRDVWVPLAKVSSGEVRLQIEAVRIDEFDESKGVAGNGWIELVLIEARDLIAADIRGTSDPYVRVQYGNLKRRTKVMYKTLNPKWNQTFEIPEDGSPLQLHVKDHNALLPTSSIGSCVVEYQMLSPNQKSDKWIPLQGVKKGEIHIQITRKIPDIEKQQDSEQPLTNAHQISTQMKQMMNKLEILIEDGDSEGLSTALSELEILEDMQEEYMVQLETEQMLLLNKIKELGQEFFETPYLSRKSSSKRT